MRDKVTIPELREMGFTDREIERGMHPQGMENVQVLGWLLGKRPWPFDGRRRDTPNP